MKTFRLFILLVCFIVILCSEADKADSEKNFLKKSNIEKSVIASSVSSSNSNAATVNVQLKMETQKPIVANNIFEKSEEEKYELERANAMAEFIF